MNGCSSFQKTVVKQKSWNGISFARFLSVIRMVFAFLHWQTILSATWRFAVSVCDWRTAVRRVTGRPIVDVVFISNMRDEVDRCRYMGKFKPKHGHVNGTRYWFHGISARVKVLNVTAAELGQPKTRREAKEMFLDAVRWAEKNGAKVILLAAGTKRLFGRDDTKLKKLFPDLIFTIGDNGTSFLLVGEVLSALNESGLRPNSRVAVLAPYGLLGSQVVKGLKAAGYTNIIGAGPNGSLESLAREQEIETCHTFKEMSEVDAVVACTHSEEICLSAGKVELIRRKGRKLLLIDVAEPSNLGEIEYEKCKNMVVRQDAGNAYSSGLKYVLGAISYRMFRLSRGVMFGCFAEAIALFSASKRKEDIKKEDWFIVDEEKMEIVSRFFEQDNISIPVPRCFGREITSLDLSLRG